MHSTSQSAESFLGYCLANRYKLVKNLGQGGMGFVFVAEDLELPRTVAVKMIKPELAQDTVIRQRVERECAMHASVGMHPNVIALHDKIIEGGKLFLIMEYVEGETLEIILREQREGKRQVSFNQSIQIITQLLAALNIIHKNNIVHRDIKPSNIIVIPPGKQGDSIAVKLMDFGIARSESDAPDETRLTAMDSAGPGTPAYMAPERIDHNSFGDFSPATDLYSLGIIFYELIHTQPPFLGSLTDVFTAHITKIPDIEILELSASFKNVIARSLNKVPEDRFASAADFKSAIDLASAEPRMSNIIIEVEENEGEGITLLTTPEMHLPVDSSKQTDEALSSFKRKHGLVVCGLVIVTAFLSVFLYYFLFNNEAVTLSSDPFVTVQESSVESPLIISVKDPEDGYGNEDSPEEPEPIPAPPPLEFYPGYSPPEDPFNRLANPSPFVGNDKQRGYGRAEGSITDAIGSQRKYQSSQKNTNKKSKQANDSSDFTIRKHGTRLILAE